MAELIKKDLPFLILDRKEMPIIKSGKKIIIVRDLFKDEKGFFVCARGGRYSLSTGNTYQSKVGFVLDAVTNETSIDTLKEKYHILYK